MDTKEFKGKILKNIDFFAQDIKSLNTGKANISLIEDIKVAAYSSLMPLSQIATLTTPEFNTILIQPWDKLNMDPIYNTLISSNIGLNPIKSVDEIRLPIPPLSEERRKEYVKLLSTKLENSRISIRNIRKDFLNHLKNQEEKKEISESEKERIEEDIEKIIQDSNEELNKIYEHKKQELLTI
jgi:ribosome recycling factor